MSESLAGEPTRMMIILLLLLAFSLAHGQSLLLLESGGTLFESRRLAEKCCPEDFGACWDVLEVGHQLPIDEENMRRVVTQLDCLQEQLFPGTLNEISANG